jgi:hypothetical protein
LRARDVRDVGSPHVDPNQCASVVEKDLARRLFRLSGRPIGRPFLFRLSVALQHGPGSGGQLGLHGASLDPRMDQRSMTWSPLQGAACTQSISLANIWKLVNSGRVGAEFRSWHKCEVPMGSDNVWSSGARRMRHTEFQPHYGRHQAVLLQNLLVWLREANGGLPAISSCHRNRA